MSIAALLDGLPSRRQEEADAGSTSNSRAAPTHITHCAAPAVPAVQVDWNGDVRTRIQAGAAVMFCAYCGGPENCGLAAGGWQWSVSSWGLAAEGWIWKPMPARVCC